MKQQALVTPFKIFGYVVLVLMGCAILYATTMTVTYWSDIVV